MVTDTSLEHGLKQEQLVIASPQSVVDIRQISTILRRRRLLILGVSCVAMSVTSLLALTTKPTYQSSMQILVSSHLSKDVQSNNVQGGKDSASADLNTEVMGYSTQMKLMLSSILIQKAVDSLRLKYPDITVEDIKGKKGKQEPLIVTKVEEGTGVNQVESEVLEVSFKANDPVKAQKVLQALQKVYEDYNAQQQKQRLSQGLAFFNERLRKVKNDVIQAEKNLEQFRKKNNLLDPEVQGKILLESLADTKKQLRITRAKLQDVKARYNYLQKELASSTHNAFIFSSLSKSTHYQKLLDQIHDTELALDRERLRYTDDSPVVKTLMQQRQSQMALLREEVKLTLGDKAVQGTSNTFTPLAFTKKDSGGDGFSQPGELSVGEIAKVPASLNTQASSGTENTKVSFITGESLIKQGQMVGVDQKLAADLIDVETTSFGLSANEKSLVESEQQIRSELSKHHNLIAQYKRLLPEVETNRKTLEQLMAAQRSLGLKIAKEGFDWQVLEEPHLGISLGSSSLLFLLGGVVIGPILGVAAALMGELSNDVIHCPEDLQKLTNLRLLGKVPKLPQLRTKKRLFNLPFGGWQTQAQDSPESTSHHKLLDIYSFLPSHETLDIAYQNIQILGSPLACKSLMLTSALPGEGKSTLALGLAVSAAHMHRRVLLIDANLRNPSLHTILELSNDWGLSLLLIDETNTHVKECIQPIHPAIDVLTAGPTSEDPVKLLSSGRMKELLELFEQTYDLVLIDTPAILKTVDARLMASICHGIAMVGRIGQVSQTQLAEATEIFSKSKLNLIGIIANDARDFVTVDR
ncbi:MAG: polysaccharide biosynthesis tyrosine autokinase [Stigonema ocellatum SAG 48.90 = DSM 106950]|nr:polysaccharide biosynthesis tyrosine autokinase [Stigonema ocellatum SAG 48.90 = DSM 106950]